MGKKHDPYYWDPIKKAEYEKVMRETDNTAKVLKFIVKALPIIFVISWIPLNIWLSRHDDKLIHKVIEGDLNGVISAIEEGANIHMTIKRKFTLLQVNSLHKGDIRIAKFLINHGVNVNAVNEDGDTAYDIATRNGYEELSMKVGATNNGIEVVLLK
jgi:hypothetical protein